MALVLGILGNARADGYTVRFLDRMLLAAGEVEGVEVERVHLLDYSFGACRSCYECIRLSEHRCVLRDDMGSRGTGVLWRKVEASNAMVWATPVHCWSADALMHLFIERLYPFLWSGELRGIPVATLAVASNQGFQIVADTMLCQWAFTTGARYVGGLPVHTAYAEEALRDAAGLGRRLGLAALEDEVRGRKAPAEDEHWRAYLTAPWSVVGPYVANLTAGTGDPAFSLIRRALDRGGFSRPEAVGLLEEADAAFEKHAQAHALNDGDAALRWLVKASALWTHATWKEFLEEELIKAPPPRAYRPLDSAEGGNTPE